MHRTALGPSRAWKPILLCALGVVLLLAASGPNSSAGSGGAGSSANARLKGKYSCILQGVNILPTGEKVNVHAIATFRADGKGKITASEKVSVLASKDGTYATCNYELSSGTYAVGANGTNEGLCFDGVTCTLGTICPDGFACPVSGNSGADSGTWNLQYTGDTDNDAMHCLGTKETSSLLIAAHGKKLYVSPVLGSELVLGGTCEAQ